MSHARSFCSISILIIYIFLSNFILFPIWSPRLLGYFFLRTQIAIWVRFIANLSSDANSLAFVAVSVASLRKCLVAKWTLERHVVLVNPHVVTQIAKLRELHRTLLALQYLIQTLSFCVHSVNQVVLTLILYFLVRRSRNKLWSSSWLVFIFVTGRLSMTSLSSALW